jgi:hypothetical protein
MRNTELVASSYFVYVTQHDEAKFPVTLATTRPLPPETSRRVWLWQMPDWHFDDRTLTTENTRFSQGCKWPLPPLTTNAQRSIHSSVLVLSLLPQFGDNYLSRVVSGNAHSILQEVFADAAPSIVRFCSHRTAPPTRIFFHCISCTVTQSL